MKQLLVTFTVLALIGLLALFIWIRMGRQPSPSPDQANRDLAARTKDLYKDAISITKSASPTHSYFGGAPPHSSQYTWPTRGGHPLAFLACIDCADLPRCSDLDWLPRSGKLLFFFDMQDQPWGFDPKDKGGSATIYLPEPSSPADSSVMRPPQPLPPDAVLPTRYIAFHVSKIPPGWETPELKSMGLTDGETDLFFDMRSSLYGELPHHQIGGFPDPVQNPEMDEECQLVTNGVYTGNAEGYADPRVEKLKAEASDWSLLFQMDSDDELKVMWGDLGMIYFWVRREDARKLKFDNTWVILQCG